MNPRTLALPTGGSATLILAEVARTGIAYLAALSGKPEETAALLALGEEAARAAGARVLKAGFRAVGEHLLPPSETPAGWSFAYDMEFLRKELPEAGEAGEGAAPCDAASPAAPAEAALVLEPLSEADEAEFVRVHDLAFAETPNAGAMPLEEAREWRSEGGRTAFLLRTGGRTAGVCLLAFPPASVLPPGSEAHLDAIGLLPDFRGKGLGRAALAAAEGIARSRGARSLTLTVATANRAASALYRAAGYRRDRLFARWYEKALAPAEGGLQGPGLATTPEKSGNEGDAVARGALVTARRIADDLARLGIRRGDTVVAHVAMSRMGWVCGGAQAVVQGLLAAVGLEGTLVMPSQTGGATEPSHWRHPPVPRAWWDEIRREMPGYDPAVTPTRGIGAVAEAFRTWPGIRRGNHPHVSFAALGPRADRLVFDQPLAFGFGEGTPCAALYHEDARCLLLGVGYDRCTEIHYAETRSGCRGWTEQGGPVLDPEVEGGHRWAVFPEMKMDSDDFPEAVAAFDATDRVAHGKVGLADARLFRVRDAVDAAEAFFRAHDLRRLGEADRGWLVDYLSDEPDVNLFLLGDLEGYGFDRPFQDLFAYERDGRVDSVLLRYNDHFIPYSRYADFDPEPLLRTIRKQPENSVSGKREVIERLKPGLPTGFRFRETFLSRLEAVRDPGGPHVADDVARATLEDVEELVDLYCRIDEFGTRNRRDAERASMARTISEEKGRYCFVRREGRIVAAAATTAENTESAMVVGVATDPAFRRQGLATHLVAGLCRDVLSGGRKRLCLFYDNPAAGAIYRRIGFAETGTWVMGTPAKEEGTT